MVADIKAGKYDAILAYHPDRLARNMTEGGIITDMLQPPNPKSKIPTLKTLAFPTMSFTNDSGGRLLLSIQFVLATNYSDHLSEQVVRGNTKNLDRGAANGTPKWGYDRNALTGEYTPDKNYDVIKTAWDMVITGASKREAARYIVDNNVYRMSKITRKNKVSHPIYASKNVEHIFSDSFYYRELHQGGEVLDLKEKWPNFKPMVTREQYLKVQRDIAIRNNNKPVGHKTSIRSDNSRSKDFLPLRGLVRCAECKGTMHVHASRSRNGDKYVYYTCKNADCKMKNKAVRGHIIFDYILKVLKKLQPDEETFKRYESSVEEYINIELADYEKEAASLRGQMAKLVAANKAANAEYIAIASQGDLAPKGVLEQAKKKCDDTLKKVDEQKSLIKAIEDKLKDPELFKMTEEEFSNLLKTAADKIQAADFVQKDQIVRILFSNLYVSQEKGPFLLCNPEFEGLFRLEYDWNGAPD